LIFVEGNVHSSPFHIPDAECHALRQTGASGDDPIARRQRDHRPPARPVSRSALRIDGRRKIGGFYLSGDMLGVQVDNEHTFSAEAITDCEVLLINRRLIMARVGLSIEAVCRMLAHLEATGTIEVHARQIVLRNRSALRQLNA
jgi:hypothetical protein